MYVKVIILRKVAQDREVKLRPLLTKLRALATAQDGYISGETLINAEDPDEFLVISTWKSVEFWNEWLANKERQALQKEVDNLLGAETLYQVYYSG